MNESFICLSERERETETDRERGMNVARSCEPASARLSLQAMRLSYIKNSDFTPSLQINIMLLLASQ